MATPGRTCRGVLSPAQAPPRPAPERPVSPVLLRCMLPTPGHFPAGRLTECAAGLLCKLESSNAPKKRGRHVEYKDYYKLLGVARDASQDQISKGFQEVGPQVPSRPQSQRLRGRGEVQGHQRGLRGAARPGESASSTTPSATTGSTARTSSRPPDYDNVRFHFGGAGGPGQGFDAGNFSDFFETIFGGSQGGFGGARPAFGRRRLRGRRQAPARRAARTWRPIWS